jgi:hypothetical protein
MKGTYMDKRPYSKWTDEEIAYLRATYHDFTLKELAEKLPRHSLKSINKKAFDLGIVKYHYAATENKMIPDFHRLCRSCGEIKPIGCFYPVRTRQRTTVAKTFARCIDCVKSSYRPNHEKYRARELQRKYGITAQEYDSLLQAQNGVCAVCGNPEKITMYKKVISLCVDHCHTTGKIRGLLCSACNKALGALEDSPERVEALLNYIQQHS